jgi:outer membrane biosynthesis protein TonB
MRTIRRSTQTTRRATLACLAVLQTSCAHSSPRQQNEPPTVATRETLSADEWAALPTIQHDGSTYRAVTWRDVRPVHRAKLTYPPNARHISNAECNVRYYLAATALVVDVQLENCTHPAFAQATLDAARRWTFEIPFPPGQVAEPVSFVLNVAYRVR